MGEIYATWSKYDRALQMYQRVLDLGKDSSSELQCSALSHMAIIYATRYQMTESLDLAEQALTLATSSANLHAQAEALEAKGEALAYSKPGQAFDVLHSAIELFEKTGDSDGQARATLNLGFANFESGSVDQLLSQYEQAAQLWKSTGNLHGQAQAEMAMGLLFTVSGEPDRALAANRRAREIFHRIGDLDGEAGALNALGIASRELGEYREALKYHLQAQKLFAQAGDELGAVLVADDAAQAYWLVRRYSKAQSLYLHKLHWAQQHKDDRVQAS